MANWIDLRNTEPPECLNVLLYIKCLSDPANDFICSGMLMEIDEGKKYYLGGDLKLNKDKYDITHWTLFLNSPINFFNN